MQVDSLVTRLRAHEERAAIVWRNAVYRYAWLLERYASWCQRIESEQVEPGSVAVLEADFSPNAVALVLALAARGCILVPLTSISAAKRRQSIDLAQGQIHFRIDSKDNVHISRLRSEADHPLLRRLRGTGHPGLVLFTSGSTGKPKAALHDLTALLAKFTASRRAWRTVGFLHFDHIGGLNTLFHVLSNGGCLVTVQGRSPDQVLRAIEDHRVELLPTSPTFLNLLLLSKAYERYALASLELITYGTEPMPESTLRRLGELFPRIRLQQTYGLSEVGILASRSKDPQSLWVKLGGEGFQTRVVDAKLEIKAQSAMLGYLNAPSPFTADGWFQTGDVVDVDGDYFRIIGREGDIINVGGEKVHPAAVESVIQEMVEVAEAIVYGKSHLLMGQIVCAKVRWVGPEGSNSDHRLRIRDHCRRRLNRHEIPVHIELMSSPARLVRTKKPRIARS